MLIFASTRMAKTYGEITPKLWLSDELKKCKVGERALEAIAYDGGVLRWIPEELKGYEECLTAVTMDGKMLQFVPVKHKTYELCKVAVCRSAFALPWVPHHLRTYDICEIAVKGNGEVLNHCPQDFVEKLYDLAYFEDSP